MKTAVVTLAYGEHLRGAEMLFHSLRLHGMPADCDAIVLSPEPVSIDFARNVVVSEAGFPYLPTQNNYRKMAAYSLGYDRVLTIDSDVMCIGDCRMLWSDHLNSYPIYATRDYGATDRHLDGVRQFSLDPDLIFNAGVLVYNHWLLPDLYRDFIDSSAAGLAQSYNNSDQGWLNCYCQQQRIPVGWLPPEYNFMLAGTFPMLPANAVRLIHYVGPVGKPWDPPVDPSSWRAPWLALWWRLWGEYLERRRSTCMSPVSPTIPDP